MSTTAAAIAAAARLVAPVVADLYRAAKGKVQKELANWSATQSAKTIAKTLVKIESVKTLYSPDKEISIHDFYFPSKIGTEGNTSKVASLDDLPDGNVTIQGIVGQGKSIFMRYMASTAIRSSKLSKLPIFIELRTLSSKTSLRKSVVAFFESIGAKVSDETFEYLANSGRLVLLLDGFDEVREEYISDLLEELEFFKLRYPELRLIVSSRPGNEIQKTTGFRVVELSPLERSDYSPFLERLGLDSAKRSEIVRAISKSPSHITGIIRTPLMMTLVVMVYETEKEIPPTLPEFFERLFQVVFTRHDRLKAGFNRKHHSGLSERKLQLLFEAFCFMTLQFGYGRSLSREQFSNAFDTALEYTQECKCDVEKFRLDITKVACLMLDEGIDLATFLHKSILEYYAASFIRHSPDDVARLFYTNAIANYRQWSEVLSFLRDIDPYRFARYFTMVETPPVAERVARILQNRQQAELIAFIEEHQPKLAVTFLRRPEERSPKEFIRYFSPVSPPAAECFKTFIDLIVRAIQEAMPNSFSASDIDALIASSPFSRSTSGHRSEVSITFDAIIREYGDKEFWLSLSQFDRALKNQIDSATDLMASQEKRKLIFERKTT